MRAIRNIAAAAALTAALATPGSAAAITGGLPASEPYPHMAVTEVDGDFICGGSLVASDWVLTAAHCVVESDATRFTFLFGARNAYGDGERIAATRVVVHPSYEKPEDSSHDVALFKLDREPERATPIALADPSTERSFWEAGDPARVIGYGGQAFQTPSLLGDLMEVDVPIVADDECRDSYELTGGGFEADTMVCAGELYGVKDSCQGDSGGPLMVRNAASRWVQVGVVSWGFGCGFPTQYGVYSRVGDVTLGDWIRSQIGGGTAHPGGIAGRVTEQKSRAALASATVSCSPTLSATTAVDGTYSIADVPAGTHTCTASKAGYASKSTNVTVAPDAVATADFRLRKL